ncbi:hypothetical protein VTL71DRAFT_10203 [Oculimacula yallundae]|uniref:Uncharacterized protein n=1 Tax=Oculimacula yallundae TaxID=86028 RepID=A0ABR4BPX6_9HELO
MAVDAPEALMDDQILLSDGKGYALTDIGEVPKRGGCLDNDRNMDGDTVKKRSEAGARSVIFFTSIWGA